MTREEALPAAMAPAGAPAAAGKTGVLLRNVAATALARGGAILLDGLAYVLVVRYLGPADYGHYVAILAWLLLVDFAADLTVLDITVREIAKDPGRTSVWLTAATVFRLALALLGLSAFAVYLSLPQGALPADLESAAWLAAVLLLAGPLRMPLTVYRAQLRMHYELAITVLTRLLNLVLVGIVIARQGSLFDLFLVVVASRLLLGVLSWAFLGPARRLAWDGAAFRHLVRESIPMGLSGLAVAVQLKVDILVVTAVVGAAAGGLYGAVAQLPEYFLYLPVIITTPMLPMMSRLFAEGDRGGFAAFYQKLVDVLVALIVPVVVAGMLVPREAVAFLFGPAFAGAAEVLPFMVVCIAVMWVSHAAAIAAVATGQQGSFVWIQGVCVSAFLALCALLIPGFGPRGAATARLVAVVLAPVLTYVVIRRRTGFTLQGRLLLRILLAGAVMGALVAALAPASVGLALAVGVLAYAAALLGARAEFLRPLVAGESKR
jgi:O-antigen/teichoic acid export membrane protein